MPTALVTGGRGFTGSRTVERLAGAGWTVACVDRGLPDAEGPDGASFSAADLTERGVARELIEDVAPDAVVHFAAIPSGGSHPGSHVFGTNTMSTYHVLDAAGREGVPAIWSSSVTAYGLFDDDAPMPGTLPILEDRPLRPTGAYPTSKVAGEAVAGRVANDYGVPVASLRLSLVTVEGGRRSRRARERYDPDAEGVMQGVGAYVDARDVASFVERALDAALGGELSGHEAFNVAAADNCLDRPTAAVARAAYGRLPDDCDLEGEEPFFSIAKARERLGWEPERSWRETEAEERRVPAFAGPTADK